MMREKKKSKRSDVKRNMEQNDGGKRDKIVSVIKVKRILGEDAVVGCKLKIIVTV